MSLCQTVQAVIRGQSFLRLLLEAVCPDLTWVLPALQEEASLVGDLHYVHPEHQGSRLELPSRGLCHNPMHSITNRAKVFKLESATHFSLCFLINLRCWECVGNGHHEEASLSLMYSTSREMKVGYSGKAYSKEFLLKV